MQNSLAFVVRVLAVVCLGVAAPLAATEQASANTIVRFDTNMGVFDVELYDNVAPISVVNFLTNMDDGFYTNTIVHRSVSNFVIQGGGFNTFFGPIPNNGNIPLEYSLPNTRGTLSMARASSPNSGNSQWFINTIDNSTNLAPRPDNPNTPGNEQTDGYAVFGRVLGNGMNVVDAIASLPKFNMSLRVGNMAMGELPLINYTVADYNGLVPPDTHTVVLNSISVVAVPEPASLALAGLSVAAFAGIASKSRRRRVQL